MLLALGGPAPAAYSQSVGLVSTYLAGASGARYAITAGEVSGDGRANIATVGFDNTTAGMLVELATKRVLIE